MRPDEYDVAELTRLMMLSSQVEDGIHDVDPLGMTEDERECLYDARYHAHKLARLLFRLAKAADDARGQSQATVEE